MSASTMQAKGGREALLALVAFAVWTGASFLCHRLAKTAVVFFSQHFLGTAPLLAPVIVTLWQVMTCYFTVRLPMRRDKLLAVMAVSHTAATLATNCSLTLIFASSAMAVKLLEPMTSALMQSLLLKVPVRAESALSLIVIIVGAVLFVGDPLQDALVFKGVWMAMLSNVVLGVRNVAIKLHQVNEGENAALNSFRSIACFGVLVGVVTSALYAGETVLHLVPPGSTHFLLLCLASSVCHVTYSYVSVSVILRCMSVVGHAVANIVKRVLVVLLLHFSGRRSATPWNWAGLVVCTAGLLLYNGRKILFVHAASSSSSPSFTAKGLIPSVENRDKSGDPGQKNTLLWRVLLVVLSLNVVVVMPEAWQGEGRDFAPDLRHSHVTLKDIRPEASLNKSRDFALHLRHSQVMWKDGLPLMKDIVTFQPAEMDQVKIDAFLQQNNLLLLPNNTDQLSPYLTTSKEVIDEATRVHDNLFSNLIGSKRYVILIGAASFENKGDPAITIGQLKIFQRLKLKLLFYINEQFCTDAHFQQAVGMASRYSRDEVVIMMQGGGNIIGYPGANTCRLKSFLHFPHHQTILLSQSVFMRGSRSWVDRMVQAYCCRPQLTIFLRDRLSFNIASRLFVNGTRVLLVPDMAFGVGLVPRFSPPFYDVLWLRRYDGERPELPSTLTAFPAGVSVHVADWFGGGWNTPHGTTTLETAHTILQNGLLFLQRGRVVVTERLHGHIISTLLDLPHVLLDNPDNKLSSYHLTWTRGLRNVRLAYSQQEAVRLCMELLQQYGSGLPTVFPGMDIKQ